MKTTQSVVTWSLSFVALVVSAFVSGPSAYAEGARVWRVVDASSEFPDFAVFSPSLRYLSVLVRTEQQYFVSIRRFDKKKQTYRELKRVPVNFPDICAVSDAGDVSYQEYSREIITVDRHGRLIRSEQSDHCRQSPHNTSPIKKRDFAAERKLLCSIPANTRIKTPGSQARIYDIAGIRGTLPGGLVVADVVTYPMNAESIKYKDYLSNRTVVTIDTSEQTKNYCITSSLTPSPSDPSCQLAANSADGPFFRQFNLTGVPYSPEASTVTCTYRLSYSMPQGFNPSNVQVAVEWLVGEYSENTIVSHDDFPGPSGAPDIVIDVGTDCGHVVELTSTDPRLRNNAFGLGNLWCSHY